MSGTAGGNGCPLLMIAVNFLAKWFVYCRRLQQFATEAARSARAHRNCDVPSLGAAGVFSFADRTRRATPLELLVVLRPAPSFNSGEKDFRIVPLSIGTSIRRCCSMTPASLVETGLLVLTGKRTRGILPRLKMLSPLKGDCEEFVCRAGCWQSVVLPYSGVTAIKTLDPCSRRFSLHPGLYSTF